DGANGPAPTGCDPGPRRRDAGQRHRPVAPCRGAGPAGGRPVYLHQGGVDGALRHGPPRRRNPGLVRRQLPQALLPHGVHGGADAGSPLAGAARGAPVMAEPKPIRLILASSSPARRELMGRLGLAFEVLPAHIDEPTGYRDPRTFVQAVSWLKA